MEPEFWTQCRVSGTLARLEGVLNKDNVDSYLKRLSSAPHILQIFLSGASDGLFSFVSNVIERGFPSAPGLFKDSTSSIMLSQLSLSLFFLTFPADFAAPSNLADCRRSVELSIPVLDALPFLTFQTEDHEPETIYDDDDMPFKVTQKSQSKNKKHKKPKKPVNDEAPFRNLGVDVPCSPQEAEKLGSDILADQKGILLYYLEILRRPGLGEYLPRLYDTEREQKGVKVDVDSSAQGGQNDEHMGVPAMESAYPIVQPMKAALYFESAKGLGDWHIFVSTRADRDLRAARKKDPDTFKIIAKKIGDLSKGHFSKDNQKRLTGPSLDVPIYEAKMTGDLRLVYQIDCIPEFDSDIERQVIKIFGIYTHAQMDNRLWEYVGHQLSGRGKEYRRRYIPQCWTALQLPRQTRCIFRNKPLNSGDNVIPPASFPPQSDGTEESSQILPQIPQNYLQEIHSILVLEKFVTLSQAFLNSILADRDVAHVFAVSPYEREIIEHTSSCYVIGRSGTGKTTTMLFKMLGIQRSWEQHSFSMPKPRQIFVTRSPILAVKVEEYFTKLLKSLGIASSKPRDLVQGDDIAGDLQVVRTLADLDENAEWRVDLPKRFSLLRPEHFPLFISFDHLCSMLEGDFGQSISASREVSTETHSTTDEIYTGGRQPVKGHDSMVSYDKFLEEYWPHLPQALTKGLDPALVFNEIMVLRRLCKNPNGMFWAGDTAQTISIGSSFKFNDLKAFLHRLEFANHVEARLKSRSTVTYSPEPPRTFQLAINYRSHAGIVRCAHSIVELITRFWPHSIDSLGEEKGIVEGLRPIFFGCSDLDTVRYEQFLFGESAARIEFGARQCILVRNETAKDELRQHVGDIGVILTLYESKGLEFDDVLLYNFFADSSCTLSQWRMILAVVVEIGPSARAPTFNEVRHAGICNELKFLYVAVTRARNNLWIYDPSDKAQPMQTFWSTNGCIDLYTSKMELPKLAVSSTPEEWSGTGWSLFENRRYYQAMHCFQRAGLKYETDIASAYHLRDHARSIHSLASARSKAFMEAADAFVGVAAASNQPRDRLTYMKNAAQCYVLAEDVRKAAQAFLDAEEFTLAASQYQKAGLFDEAIEVIRTTQVEADIAGTICHTARLFYLQKKRLKQAATLFDSVEDELCFMEDFGFDDVRADVLESMDKHAEAAAIHLEEGQLFDGIRLLLKDRTDPLAQQRAKEHLKDCFWQIMSLDCDDVILDAGRIGSEQLLHWTRQIEETTGRHGLDDEMRMFKAISSGDYVSLERLGHMLARSNLKAAAFLCFTHVFRPCSLIPTMSAKEASGFLSSFVTYTELLRHVATHQAPHISKSISKLFGFRLEPQGSVLLPKGTFFHKVSSRKKSRVLGSNDDGIRLSEAQFLGLYKHSLAGYALDIVLEEDNHWQELKALRPCLALVAFGRCNAEDVCPKDHVPTSRLRADAYNTRSAECRGSELCCFDYMRLCIPPTLS
ncbi:P-loop containing nucleoside triphosphate hydrolase protein [Gloeophyllum trabeum ATCC 11539]|uniref:p-loop containing nucleoside triphosphate hydrolase protein n=1 Tax=Gloeophyllum trabeum (strain ATCC 11539 / FP-39264 / Madison 617) TaxID=670483 RepID=S7RPW7_GLOTA|nr:P-loop containing nucleoside triphosphate hydrolase protein [Gloeophyllum trabeum ATCC 11539]EPQ56620.1 P-loop containing nucleoside triphosphate hydrolase protein [Gloeophyllum trabeum ATCC 11539]